MSTTSFDEWNYAPASTVADPRSATQSTDKSGRGSGSVTPQAPKTSSKRRSTASRMNEPGVRQRPSSSISLNCNRARFGPDCASRVGEEFAQPLCPVS